MEKNPAERHIDPIHKAAEASYQCTGLHGQKACRESSRDSQARSRTYFGRHTYDPSDWMTCRKAHVSAFQPFAVYSIDDVIITGEIEGWKAQTFAEITSEIGPSHLTPDC
jgi:hypothetical protein